VPNYTLLSGNALAYDYANQNRLNVFLTKFNPVESAVGNRDLVCGLSGDRTYTGNLGSFTAPLLALRNGKGFGAYMLPQVGLFGSTSKDVSNYQPNFGHGDSYLTANHSTYIETPITNWLDSVVFP